MNTPQSDDYDFEALNAAFQVGLKRDIARAKAFHESFISDPSIQAGLKMVGEVVKERKEKKQRVAQKIGELKASVSELTLTLLMPVESDEILERRKLITEYLKLILDPVHLEGLATQFNMQMADENTSNTDLEKYIEQTRMLRTDNFLSAFDKLTTNEDMEITAEVTKRFGTGIDGIRGARELAAGSIDGAIGNAEEFSYSGGGSFRLPGGLTPIEDIINE